MEISWQQKSNKQNRNVRNANLLTYGKDANIARDDQRDWQEDCQQGGE